MGFNPFKLVVGLVVAGVGFLTGNPWIAQAGLSIAASSFAGQSLADSNRTFQASSIDPQNPVPVVYGKAKLGLKIVAFPTDSSGSTPNDYLYIVGAVCHGSQNGDGIEGFHELFLDGIEVVQDGAPDLNAGGGLVSDSAHIASFFEPAFEYGRHRGAASQAVDSSLNSTFPTEWPSSSALAGVAYVIAQVESDEGVFNWVPEVSVVVSGAKVYDPRSTDWAWSDNPALCILDMLTSKIYGAGIDYADIDLSTSAGGFAYAADHCDELVSIPGGGTQKRYTCNGVVDTNLSLEQRLNQLISSCSGSLIYEAGQFRLVIREARASTGLAITERDCVGPVRWKRLGLRDMGNAVHVAFIDPAQEYQVDVVQWPEPGSAEEVAYLEASQNREAPVAMDLPFTNDHYMALQIGSTRLKEGAPEDGSPVDSFVVVVREQFIELQVGDIISFDHPLLSGDGPIDCWVNQISLAADEQGLVGLELATYHADAYTHPTLSAKPTPPTISPPDRTVSPNVSNVALTITQAASGDQITLDVSWDPATAPILRYEISPVRRRCVAVDLDQRARRGRGGYFRLYRDRQPGKHDIHRPRPRRLLFRESRRLGLGHRNLRHRREWRDLQGQLQPASVGLSRGRVGAPAGRGTDRRPH